MTGPAAATAAALPASPVVDVDVAFVAPLLPFVAASPVDEAEALADAIPFDAFRREPEFDVVPAGKRDFAGWKAGAWGIEPRDGPA